MAIITILYQKRQQPLPDGCLFCGQPLLKSTVEYRVLAHERALGEACSSCAALSYRALCAQIARFLPSRTAGHPADATLRILREFVDQQHAIEHRMQ